MTDYEQIFLKYGFSPPALMNIPSQEDIDNFLTYYSIMHIRRMGAHDKHFATLMRLISTGGQSLKISDVEKFVSSFNINVDFSKLHPELVQSLKINFETNEKRVFFTERFNELVYSYTDDEVLPFIVHFSPEFRLLNVFMDDALNIAREQLVHYGSNTFASALAEADLSEFLSDICEFVQNNQHHASNLFENQ